MKLALFLAASLASAAFAGTVNSPYQVGTWQGFRAAAVSYTFDDNCGNQYSVAMPMFNAKGFKMTLFTVTAWTGGNWSSVQTAASYGHEIGSHTVDHATLSGLSPTDVTNELKNSQDLINANVTSQKCLTLAYPGCAAPTNPAITPAFYIAARGCNCQVEPSSPSDFYGINAIICGSAGTTDLNGSADSAASSGGWCDFLIHGISTPSMPNGDGYSPLSNAVLQASVDYMDANRSKFWVQTFGNVVRYIRERNAVSVAETGSTSNSLTVSVTDSLDNSIYNFPVTIRRPLPSGWTTATASQGGHDLGAQIVNVNGTQYVMFDAVPNDGNVTITTGITFYQDYSYGGAAGQPLAAGNYTQAQLAALSVPNDWASSVRIPSGWTVTMYSGDNFSGTSWALTSDTPNFGSLNPSANDQLSSCKVQAPASGPADGTYKLIARHSGKALDVNGGYTTNGTQIIQWTYHSANNQQWTVTSLGSGLYKVISVASGKSIDISNWGTANGTKVQIWDYTAGTNQKFSFNATDSGYYEIVPSYVTGSCLDVNGASQTDGAVVQLWQWLNGSNQQWSPQAP